MEFDFHSNFSSSVNNCDFETANKCLMTELANILVRDREDFVDMLNESSVFASSRMGDAELINLFVDNANSNKKLLLGASLLTNMHNKKMGFDGEDEISDSGVKTGYAVMNSYFNNESYDNVEEESSNFLPFGLILKGAKKLLDKRKEGTGGGGQEAAKQQMLRQAQILKEAEAKKKAKTQKTLLIGGGAVLLLGIIAIVVVKSRQ